MYPIFPSNPAFIIFPGLCPASFLLNDKSNIAKTSFFLIAAITLDFELLLARMYNALTVIFAKKAVSLLISVLLIGSSCSFSKALKSSTFCSISSFESGSFLASTFEVRPENIYPTLLL